MSIKAEVDKILSKFKTLKVFNFVYFCLSHGELSFLTLIMRSRIGKALHNLEHPILISGDFFFVVPFHRYFESLT